MTRYLIAMLAGASLSACGEAPVTDVAEDDSAAPAYAPISEADLRRRIETLSADDLQGRAPSTPGGRRASQYIADEMAAAGLEPMGEDGTYFQEVELTATQVLPESSFVISANGEPLVQGDQSTNMVAWTKRLDPTLAVTDSELVFVGYGVVAPEYGWNDYEGLDVAGKTVVMLVNDPGFATQNEALFRGNAMTYYGRWTYKFEEAGRQGAAAAIVIHQTAPASYGWDVVSGSWTGEQYDLVRPDGGASRTQIESWVSEDTAKAMFAASGLDFDALSAAAASADFTPVAMDGLSLTAILEQDVKTTTSRNVAGGVRGTARPDEYVLYMAHWDHLGVDPDAGSDEDGIFNGAVDNATGTAAIIEIGEAFMETGAPERSAIFVAVTAEESGLLGSAHYAEDPLVPLERTVAGINIDAVLPVGRTDDIKVIGYGSSELEDRLADVLGPRGMTIVPDPTPEAGFYYRSDHISLAKKGVPMLYADQGDTHSVNGRDYGEAFAQNYTVERYHKPGDEYDASWDISGIKQVSEILFELGYTIAEAEDWPNWYEGAEFKALRDAQMRDTMP